MSLEPAAEHPLNRRRFTQDEVRPPSTESAASRALFAWYAPGFSDRLGDRLNLFDNTDGPPLELLRLRAEFSRAPDFECSLRARAAELRGFDHPRFARVCRADRLPEPGGGLALVSVRSDGVRLSDVLRLAEQRGARLSADLLLPLVADTAEALATLHALGPHVAHGAMGTDRLVIAPGGRLLVAEYVLGPALGGLRCSRADFWRQLRLALPADAAMPAFTQATDVLQLGLIALALALSRPIDSDEDLDRLPRLLDEAARLVPGAGWDGRWPGFEGWLRRALCVQGTPFANGRDAVTSLAQVAPAGARHAGPSRGGWDRFVSDCEAPPILTGRTEVPPPALGAPTASLDDWERPSTPPPPPPADPPAPPAAGAEPPLPAAWRPEPPPGRPSDDTWRPALLALVAALALAVLGGGIAVGARLLPSNRETARAGSLQVDSSPPGAAVSVNGAPAGTTPLALSLPPGRHVLELTSAAARRTVPVTLTAGSRVSQFIEMPPPVSATGQLKVTTQPEGLRVVVDGVPRGASPLVVTDLPAGAHVVAVEGRGRSARETVEVEAGAVASLFVPLAGGGPAAPGWLSVAAGVELHVYEDGQLIGTSRSRRIMLPAGPHAIDLVNEDLNVRIGEEVQVPAGGTAVVEVDLPQGRLDVNALPWAEVWLDGRRLGETPLGGIPAHVGRHVLTFRHPQLGERRADCVVAAGRTTRVGTDLRK